MTHQSQCKQLRAYMERGHYVSSMVAYDRFGITSLHRRLSDLRRQGLEIKDRWAKPKLLAKRYKIYWLEKRK